MNDVLQNKKLVIAEDVLDKCIGEYQQKASAEKSIKGKTEGKKFKEFLLVAGGEDNALIQIKGNMTYEEAKKFSDDAKKDHGSSKVELYK